MTSDGQRPRGCDVETGFQFARRLRGPIAEMNAPDWSVDWADAPWPFKVYDGGRRLPLPAPGPGWAAGRTDAPGGELWRHLASVLHLGVGCSRIRTRPDGMVASAPERPAPMNRSATVTARRAIASGGGLYPAEVYLWISAPFAGVSPGIHHYAPARHELVEIAGAVPAGRLAEALRLPSGRTPPPLALLVTNHFWKNFFKYGDFAYRLGAVDLGIAVARLDRLLRWRLGEAVTHFDFLDELLNDSLGLDGATESVYAVITGPGASDLPAGSVRGAGPQPAAAGGRPRTRQRSRVTKRSAAFDELHASVLAGSRDLATGPRAAEAGGLPPQPAGGEPLALPPLRPGVLEDLAAVISSRTSNGELFTGAAPPPEAEALATVLREAALSVDRVRAGAGGGTDLPRPRLLVVVQNVAGIPPGAYRYDEHTGGLLPTRSGDLGLALQACSNVQNINVDLSAFTVHVADVLDFRGDRRGNRAYRIQQMVVGAALDAVMLAAAGLGLGSHPMLGFKAAAVDALHGLESGPLGVLAQICVGPVRAGHHLEGSIAP